MGEMKEAKGFLALAMQHDQRLAEEVRARLADAPAEEFVLVETEERGKGKTWEEVPVERRYRGRQLFRADLPSERYDGEWEMTGAALLEDGRLLFWSDHGEGTVMAEAVSADTLFREATCQPYTISSGAWVLAMRLLGKPLWKAAPAQPRKSRAVPVSMVGVLVVPGGRRLS